MILKPEIKRCASKEADPRRGWTRGSVPVRTLGLEGGGLEGPTSIGEGNERHLGPWAPKGGGL